MSLQELRNFAEYGSIGVIDADVLHGSVKALLVERDEAVANYRSLEAQYTDLNALWMAQGREIKELRSALLHLSDTARSADRLIDYTFKNARDVHAALEHAIESARRALGGN